MGKDIMLIDRLDWFESKMENKAVFDNPLYHLGTILCILAIPFIWLIDGKLGMKKT
jgi:hypothetical protein